MNKATYVRRGDITGWDIAMPILERFGLSTHRVKEVNFHFAHDEVVRIDVTYLRFEEPEPGKESE